MAQEYRLTLDGFYGQLASQLTSGATTHTDTAWAGLPTWTGTAYYVPIALTSTGLTEIVWVTAHASGTPNQVTLARGKEGTTQRTWALGTQFAQADMRRDGLVVQPSSTSTSDFHVGQRWVEDNTGLIKMKTLLSGNVADVGVALSGDVNGRSGAPTTGATVIMRTGSAVATTNGSGDGTISFATPFPNGCLVAVASSGDPAAFFGHISPTGESASGFNFRAHIASGTVFTGTLRVQYIAVGW